MAYLGCATFILETSSITSVELLIQPFNGCFFMTERVVMGQHEIDLIIELFIMNHKQLGMMSIVFGFAGVK